MNLDQVSTYIQQPQSLGAEQIPGLKQLCEDFPYTAIYPLLYLTALSNTKSPALEEALTKYAYRLSDRTRLFHLVSQTVISDTPSEPVAAEPEKESNSIPEEITIEKPENTSSPVAGEIVVPEELQKEDERSEDNLEFEHFTIASSVEQDYFSHAEEHSETQEETLLPEKTEEKSVADSTASEKVNIDVNQSRSFMDWIKSNGQASTDHTKNQDTGLSKNEIIDRFIETQPTITRQKAEFYSPPKKAKESLNEEAMPVSETLAKIFTAQGNYPKAIHVYHQLMLANPEKKTFFAVQIEELKKKLTI